MSLRLGDTTVDGPMDVSGRVLGLIDAVKAEFTASAMAHLECIRCLTEWDETVSVDAEQYFRQTPDEDGYIMVLRTPSSPAMDLDAAISCAWRLGDVW